LPSRPIELSRAGIALSARFWQCVSALAMAHFADRLIQRVRQLGHPLCVGLDPHLPGIPPLFRRGSMNKSDSQTAAAVESFLLAVLDRVADRVAMVKPQSAFFEQLGWRGVQVLDHLVAAARARGLLVLLDAKRGDIDSTAAAYAAYLDPHGALPVDAITVNPYLGRDTLASFIDVASHNDRGVFVLVKTSNPGSGDYQDRLIDGRPLFELVAESLAEIADRLRGPATGWSSLGVVVGATYPAQSQRIRTLLPRALFLVPGYGAQGGGARDAVSGFAAGPDGRLEGGFVNSSRGILFPADGATSDARAWEQAIDAAIDRAIADLTAAVQPS
jgi:orotidine-5'-phosphate decarboxylase